MPEDLGPITYNELRADCRHDIKELRREISYIRKQLQREDINNSNLKQVYENELIDLISQRGEASAALAMLQNMKD